MKVLSTLSLFLAVAATSASAFTTSASKNNGYAHIPISSLAPPRSRPKNKVVVGKTSTNLLTAAGGHADESSSSGDSVATATIPNEIFNLVKSIIGAGVLSLPAGIAAMGNAPSAVIPATALIAIMGIISAYTFSMIARVCKYTGATSYADAWDKTRGTKISWLIAASSALDCFSGNLSYSMVLADTFRDLFSAVGLTALATRSSALLAVTGAVLFPLCLTKNLSSLAPFSLLGIMGMAYTSIAIAIRYFGGSYALPAGKFISDLSPALQPSFGSIGASGALSSQSLILICMLSTAYIAHFNAPKFFRELKNNTVDRFNIVTASSFGISIFIYAAVSAMGFLTFGANSSGLILNNYSTKDILFSFSRFAVALSLVFSYPLLFVGTRDGFLDLFKVPEEKRTDSLQNKLTVGLVALLTIMALNLRDLTFVSSISGATLGTALIFIYPTLMFQAAVSKMGDKATQGQKFEKNLAGFIAFLGVVIGAIGTKMALTTGGSGH